MNSLFDLLPFKISPFYISRLDCNIDAALLLEAINQFYYSDSDNEGYIHYTRNKLMEFTGLSENQIRKSETFLKKKKILEIKIGKGLRLYRIDSQKYSELLGYPVYSSLVRKLNHNSKASYLLFFMQNYYNFIGDEITFEIPSEKLEMLSGLDKNAQIYARDTLLSYDLLKYEKSRDPQKYHLNFENIYKL
jgi:hypothetical protein